MPLELKRIIKTVLPIIDILILVFQILLIGLIFLIIFNHNPLNIYPILFDIIIITISFIFFLISFIKNKKNEYREYISILTILKFLSYSSLLIGYILFKKENYFPTSFNDIIEKIYKIITIIVIIFIIISIYLEFLLSTPEKEAE